MFCPLCGCKLNEGAKFCGNCGASIAAAPIVAAPAPAKAPDSPKPAVPAFEVAPEDVPDFEITLEDMPEEKPAPAPVAAPAAAPTPQPFVPTAPRPAAPAAPAPAPRPFAPAAPAAPAVAPAPAAPAPKKAKKDGSLLNVLQLLLLVAAAATVVFLFLGVFGYTAGEYNNRFSLFGLCTPFVGSEVCLAGQNAIAGFLTWDVLFYLVGGIAVIGLLCVLFATLLKKPKLNTPVIVSSILLAGFTVVMFYVFRDTLVDFLTDYVINNRLSSLHASADLKECGFILFGLCALNVVLAVLLTAFGGKKKAPEPVVEVPMI